MAWGKLRPKTEWLCSLYVPGVSLCYQCQVVEAGKPLPGETQRTGLPSAEQNGGDVLKWLHRVAQRRVCACAHLPETGGDFARPKGCRAWPAVQRWSFDRCKLSNSG